MSEKQHVTMVQRICVCCGEPYDTGELALSSKYNLNGELRKIFDGPHTIMGAGLCPKCTEETRQRGGVWLFSVKQTGKETAQIEYAICVNEQILRETLLPDLPPTPDCICQCKSSLMAQLHKLAEKVQEAQNASTDATA